MVTFSGEVKRYVKRHLQTLITLCVVAASLVFGYFVGQTVQEERYTKFLRSFKNIRENSERYKFINPLIGSVSSPATTVGIYSDLKNEIVDYLKQEGDNGDLYGHSFYFRDLGSGLWFGTNENDDFFPASLFKLPIAIAVYKEGEDDLSFLKRYVIYTEEISQLNDSVMGNSKSSLVIGKSYQVEDLVAIMITESDNGAKNLLLSVIDRAYMDKLFSAISFVDPTKAGSYTISSRQYALFLRILYGSSYLNEDHSEYLMDLLSKTTFKEGLVAGLPGDILVAHKYGMYEFDETVNGTTRQAQQLHDCGVVYHEERPYIFCLMTKGKDIETLYKVISHVSKIIYENQESGESNQ